MALKQIKNKIISTQKTGKVTKAMEAVSAVKMRKSQERARAGKAYAEGAARILSHIAGSMEGARYSGPKATSGQHCFIVVTSDKGLAGSLNSAVLKETDAALAGIPKENVRMVVFGRKAHDHFLRNGYTVDLQYTNVRDDVSLADMETVARTVLENFMDASYQSVHIAYQNFVSTFEQRPALRQVLPLDADSLTEMIDDISVQKARAHITETAQHEHAPVYTIEPSAEEVMDALVPQLVQVMVYHALLENKASEHSARMVAMKNATDKAKEITKLLTITFNKERQAVITAEVSEITGGIEAMRS